MNESASSEDFPILDDSFLVELLERAQDLAELKAVLQVARLAARRGTPAVPFDELLHPEIIRSIASADSPVPGEQRLLQSLQRALANGLLLRVSVASPSPDLKTNQYRGSDHYMPATAANRDLLGRLYDDDPAIPLELGLAEGDLIVFRPNVFALFERHIGPLTPLLAEQLRDAERSYPRAWLEEAIRIAGDNEKRSWRYIQGILNRWERSGGPNAAYRR